MAPNYEAREEFARIGGRPLGLAFDRDQNLLVCIAGMGVYGVRPDRTVFKVTDRTNRTRTRLKDDSRLYLADDLDVAPDGKIYFSEASTRYELTDWALDGFEGRGNGRLICHDPKTGVTRTLLKNLTFPNGVCISHDGRSVLWASTWLCQVNRYWIAGPKAGINELLIDNLPGYCDNINSASDGEYWLALVGLRSPVYDLAMRNPGFRMRMVKQIPPDEWLCPGINYGCIVKFDDAGVVSESLWDPGGLSHPTITSVREHKGYLYIGGLENNRIGRIRLAGRRPDLGGAQVLLGSRLIHVPSWRHYRSRALPEPGDPRAFRCSTAPSRRTRGSTKRDDLVARSRDRTTCAFGPDGALYVSTESRILRCAGPDFEQRTVFATLDGLVGGLAWAPDGRLLACVSRSGASSRFLRRAASSVRWTALAAKRFACPTFGRDSARRRDLSDRRLASQPTGALADGPYAKPPALGAAHRLQGDVRRSGSARR